MSNINNALTKFSAASMLLEPKESKQKLTFKYMFLK